MIQREGVIVIPKGANGRSLLIPPVLENVGKREMVLGYHDELQEVVGREFPAGAVEQEDQVEEQSLLVMAALRELAQEAGIIASPSQFTEYPEKLRVRQERGGKMVDFTVTLLALALKPGQERWLCDFMNAMPVDAIVFAERIRPRDEAVVHSGIMSPDYRRVGAYAENAVS